MPFPESHGLDYDATGGALVCDGASILNMRVVVGRQVGPEGGTQLDFRQRPQT